MTSGPKTGVDALSLLELAIAQRLREEIRQAGGNEVFALLRRTAPQQRFNQIQMVARGNAEEVAAILSRCASGDVAVHNHPSGNLTPSSADLRVFTRLSEEGVGAMIVDNAVSFAYVCVEPFEPKPLRGIPDDLLRDIFGESGLLERLMDDFEWRPGQLRMAEAVATALNQGQPLAVEGGTGTGKSIAYLIPAALWCLMNDKRIVVATKTIALQEQLIHKDMPVVRQVIASLALSHPHLELQLSPETPLAELVKGRQNYLCRRRLFETKELQMSFDFMDDQKDHEQQLVSILQLVEAEGLGSRSEFPFQVREEVWETIRSESHLCLGTRCPHHNESPFFVARRKARRVPLMIANQALLFTDLLAREESQNYSTSAVISAYQGIILDEAHSLEEMATAHFGQRVTSTFFRKHYLRLMGQQHQLSLVGRLQEAMMKHHRTEEAYTLLDECYGPLLENRDAFFTVFEDWIHQVHLLLGKPNLKQFEIHLSSEVLAGADLEALRQALLSCGEAHDALLESLIALESHARRLLEDDGAFEGLLLELQALVDQSRTLGFFFHNFAQPGKDEVVQSLKLSTWGRGVEEFQYTESPLDVRSRLKRALFDCFPLTIMTSATLNLNDEFTFFRKRLGLDQRPLTLLKVETPFCLKEQATLLICRNLPPASSGQHDEMLAQFLSEGSRQWRGGTLVLFTNYANLRKVAALIRQRDPQVLLYVQGELPRSQLIHQMKALPGLLLGTDSFWEGVDLKGNALTTVIMAKLPFKQLGDPVFEARCRLIRQSGESDFVTYSLPLALLKFKQGLGRLIRSKSDRGRILVTDERLLNKGYGKRFLTLAEEFNVLEIINLDQLTGTN
jgi:ATP-dependent DNA helicase DinG